MRDIGRNISLQHQVQTGSKFLLVDSKGVVFRGQAMKVTTHVCQMPRL